jgi:quercetin dioxygenase-like cupin family protein
VDSYCALSDLFVQVIDSWQLRYMGTGKIDYLANEGVRLMAAKQAYAVETWMGDSPPRESEIRRLLSERGLSGYRWSNAPGDVYGAHSHPFHKIIYVLQGSITFTLPDVDEQVTLGKGDRLDLPAGMVHEAVVGQQGVICFEAHENG